MEIMIDSMFKNRDEFIENLGRPLTFEERRLIYWAFRYVGKEKAPEYLATKIAGKKEEKIVKVKNKEEVN
jgi:hypothetical protein